MNYRHAFHAGNHADVLKHAILMLALARMAGKPASLGVLDTHAGAGLYDLEGPEATRSPEWRGGVGRLTDWPDAPACLAEYIKAVAADPRVYPGSPLLACRALRAQDRYIGCELHPADASALKKRLAPWRQAQVHARCGYEAMAALLPLAERRGLVLIDPPYERGDDLERSVTALQQALGRFRQGVYLWWRPLKDRAAIAAADAALLGGTSLEWLRADLDIGADGPGLGASSVLVLNPPYALAEALTSALPALARRLDRGGGGHASLNGAV
jgi:23S rRNA (adenine2030-N6)-methyltransferase